MTESVNIAVNIAVTAGAGVGRVTLFRAGRRRHYSGVDVFGFICLSCLGCVAARAVSCFNALLRAGCGLGYRPLAEIVTESVNRLMIRVAAFASEGSDTCFCAGCVLCNRRGVVVLMHLFRYVHDKHRRWAGISNCYYLLADFREVIGGAGEACCEFLGCAVVVVFRDYKPCCVEAVADLILKLCRFACHSPAYADNIRHLNFIAYLKALIIDYNRCYGRAVESGGCCETLVDRGGCSVVVGYL